jgi:hypothetical protein
MTEEHQKAQSGGMRARFLGLAVAGYAVFGLVGCGSSPATGSAEWTNVCTVIRGLPSDPGAIAGNTNNSDLAALAVTAWADSGKALGDLGYDALASDAQRVAAAMTTSDVQGALTADTQFTVDKGASNLSGC